jgi:hypothetical protein
MTMTPTGQVDCDVCGVAIDPATLVNPTGRDRAECEDCYFCPGCWRLFGPTGLNPPAPGIALMVATRLSGEQGAYGHTALAASSNLPPLRPLWGRELVSGAPLPGGTGAGDSDIPFDRGKAVRDVAH